MTMEAKFLKWSGMMFLNAEYVLMKESRVLD
mgnify:CR=1 FL=1